MKKAYFQKQLDSKVQCRTCSHFCTLKEGEVGKCGVRKNRNGDIYVLNYGKLAARSIDPIEKKPLYHFLPGTESLSVAAQGCSLKCENCQNWRLSQVKEKEIKGKNASPEKIVEEAAEKNVGSISYTYGEPTIFLEYALDTMRLAYEKNIKNVWVTNGFMSKEVIEEISGYLDGVNVDLKSFSDEFYKNICGGRLQPVLSSIKKLSKTTWLEITTLIIPDQNDKKEELKQIARFIYNLDPEIPWHISKFSGQHSWKMKDIPTTPDSTLKKAYQIGKSVGLKHVYVGNTFSAKTNTHCPQCNELVIKRKGFSAKKMSSDFSCPGCGYEIKLITN